MIRASPGGTLSSALPLLFFATHERGRSGLLLSLQRRVHPNYSNANLPKRSGTLGTTSLPSLSAETYLNIEVTGHSRSEFPKGIVSTDSCRADQFRHSLNQ